MVKINRLLRVSTGAIPEKLALREFIDWLQTKGFEPLYSKISIFPTRFKPCFCGNTPKDMNDALTLTIRDIDTKDIIHRYINKWTLCQPTV